MGQDLGTPQPYAQVGQQMGRYQEGTAPQMGADPKAKNTPPGPELGGLPGLTPDAGLPGAPQQTPQGMDRLKMLLAQIMQQGRR